KKAVFEEWVAVSPTDTAAFLIHNGYSSDKQLGNRVAEALVDHDADAALQWAAQLDESVSGEIQTQVISTLAASGPMRAMDYLLDVPDQILQDSMLKAATSSWGREDPAATMAWLAIQPTDARVDDLMIESAANWVRDQPAAASEWIGAMENIP